MAAEGRRSPRKQVKPAPKPRRPAYKGDPAVQIARGRLIAARRTRVIGDELVPVAWKDIAAELGVAVKTAQQLYKRYLDGAWDAIDSSALVVVDHSIDTHTALIDEAQRQVHQAVVDEDLHGAIKAMRAVSEFTLTRMKIMIAAGRMPSNLTELQTRAQMDQLVNLFMAFLEDEKLTDAQVQRFLKRVEQILPSSGSQRASAQITPG